MQDARHKLQTLFRSSLGMLKTAAPLTIIATALIDTGSKMDVEVIFEEFKGVPVLRGIATG